MKVLIICVFVLALSSVSGCAISCLALSYQQDNIEISAEFRQKGIDGAITFR